MKRRTLLAGAIAALAQPAMAPLFPMSGPLLRPVDLSKITPHGIAPFHVLTNDVPVPCHVDWGTSGRDITAIVIRQPDGLELRWL